jgi:large subunit ribosomal protein L10
VGLGDLDAVLRGPTAIAFSLEDPTAAARELAAFAKDHQQIQVKGGVLAGRVIGPDDVRALADLPGREVLLARLAGAMAGPLVAMAAVLAAPLRALAIAADQLAKSRGSGAA